jgi:hypothetical protein
MFSEFTITLYSEIVPVSDISGNYFSMIHFNIIFTSLSHISVSPTPYIYVHYGCGTFWHPVSDMVCETALNDSLSIRRLPHIANISKSFYVGTVHLILTSAVPEDGDSELLRNVSLHVPYYEMAS